MIILGCFCIFPDKNIYYDPAFPFTLYRGFFTPKFGLYPKNGKASYMLLYIEGTEIRNKTRCTPNSKMQWEAWTDPLIRTFLPLCVTAYVSLRN